MKTPQELSLQAESTWRKFMQTGMVQDYLNYVQEMRVSQDFVQDHTPAGGEQAADADQNRGNNSSGEVFGRG